MGNIRELKIDENTLLLIRIKNLDSSSLNMIIATKEDLFKVPIVVSHCQLMKHPVYNNFGQHNY